MRIRSILTLACSLVLTNLAWAQDTVPSASTSSGPLAVRLADMVLDRWPKGTMIDQKKDNPRLVWSYSNALLVRAVEQVGEATHDQKYITYAKDYANAFLAPNGSIPEKFSKPDAQELDSIAPGQLMLRLFHLTKDARYEKAAKQLLEEIKAQPRTADGGFWHKKIYPHQMWLDGIFMGSTFLADAGKTFEMPDVQQDGVTQILTIAKHTLDPKTGLYYHAWDESKSQKWANPETGQSPNFWGRADGWFAMGTAEVLSYLPADAARRADVVTVFHSMADAVAKVQDPATGCWWQVMDQPGKEGNYLESSATAMFAYAFAKGAKSGDLPASAMETAKRAYEGIQKTLLINDADGKLALKDTCAVAGLGGKPYRDGSYEYYIHEKRATNDPKGLGPLILAALEFDPPVAKP